MMMKLTRDQTMPAIRVLVGTSYVDALNRKHAIEEMLGEIKITEQKSAATDTVALLLNFFEENPKSNRGLDAITLAVRIGLVYRPHNPVAERLSKTAALCGFNLHFPELPILLLNRQPNAEEVGLLISAYAQQKGDRERSSLQKLRDLAKTYLPQGEANARLERI